MARTRYQAAGDSLPISSLPAAALRAVLREGYTREHFKHDVLAGVVVGVVALPLAMALAIAVGVAPQHGLYTAIVAGGAVALLGGSRTQVTGPTAAFIVVLAPIFTRFGLAGLLLAGALGGLMLLAMGAARLGRLIEFIPHPVTTGFTAGIAVVIATLQLKDFCGLDLPSPPDQFLERVAAMVKAMGTAHVGDMLVGACTLALLLTLPKVVRRVPAPLIALPVGALLALALTHFISGLEVSTVASRFHHTVDGAEVAGIPRLPPMPMLPWNAPGPQGQAFVLSLASLRELLASAFAIAMLGAIESLLSAVVADGMARTRHDPDAELLALGVGNVVAPFFGGIPATGAIARTATNIRSGARSPVAAVVHAVTVLLAILLLAPLIGHLPMASLAALLLLVAWNMSEVKHFGHILRVAPRSDVVVLLTCFGLTVIFDMVIAVTVGVVLAALLFMRRMAEVTKTQLSEGEARGVLTPLPKGVVVYDINGPLFFGAAQKAMGALGQIGSTHRVVILRMDRVPAMDATGLVALESAVNDLGRKGVLTILVGPQSQPAEVLAKGQLHKRARVEVQATMADALASAEAFLTNVPRTRSGRFAADAAPASP